MKTIDQIYRDNLQRLIDEYGSQSNLATAIGKSKAQISQWMTAAIDQKTQKPRSLSPGSAREIEKLLGKEIGWMDNPASDSDKCNLRIPQYDTGGAMGHGFALSDDQPGLIRSWSVSPDWLRLNVPVHTGLHNLCIVTGFGPSMQPRFNPGDPLLCDRGVTDCKTDGLYFFRLEGHGFIKQLQRVPTATGMVLRAKSFNPDYEPFDIIMGMDFQILGRILTVWRSEQF